MSSMNPVQQKISCVYKTGVVDEPSSKRQHQTFRVVAATRELNCHVCKNDISSARATEKIDGTCCLVDDFEGKPWLWARHDRKPSKVGERRFGQYKRTKSKILKESNDDNESKIKPFEWEPLKDFKDVPEHWIPALRLEVKDGVAMPDDIGHTPGWVPVQAHQRQHCWHLEAVDLLAGTALVLREAAPQSTALCNSLVVESVPLSTLVNQTCELIGTNVNGNPYGLGSKKNPFHILVPHGSMSLTCPDPCDFDAMWDWMALTPTDADGAVTANQVEGVVWHCENGQLYKLHRHHLNLKWPDGEPSLCQRRVHVKDDNRLLENLWESSNERDTDGGASTEDGDKNTRSLLWRIASLNGQSFDSLKVMCDSLVDT